jgi:hypothetical protein
VVGKKLRINGMMSEIVGVSEQAPRFPTQTDVLVNMVTSPHHLDATMVHGRSHRMTDVFARLAPARPCPRPNMSSPRSGPASARITRGLRGRLRATRFMSAQLRDALTGKAKKTLYLLMATAALVLITACANVANLVLTRSVRRERELTVRWALGADRGKLRRLLLSETGILAVAGAALGIVFAYVGLGVLVGFAQRFTPRA